MIALITANPVASVVVALAVGLVIGTALARLEIRRPR